MAPGSCNDCVKKLSRSSVNYVFAVRSYGIKVVKYSTFSFTTSFYYCYNLPFQSSGNYVLTSGVSVPNVLFPLFLSYN